MRKYALSIVTSFLFVAACASVPPQIETRAVSDRSTVTTTQPAADTYRIDFEADMSKPPSEADRFMPSGSPILAEAERVCPASYSIVDMSEVDFETDQSTDSLIARSSGTVSCLSERKRSPRNEETL